MMKLPNFFIIGAPKAGTTAMSEYLRAHPQVFFSTPKEPHYFNMDFSDRYTKEWSKYVEYFSDVTSKHIAIGEGSVFYLRSSVAIKNILKLIPNAKFIVMLRNPVDAVYSWHSQAIYSFGEDIISFEDAWNVQDERKSGNFIPPLNTVREALQYGWLCKFGEQLNNLYTYSDKRNVKIIWYDDFSRDASGSYSQVVDFLGLDNNFDVAFERHNVNKTYHSFFLKKTVERIVNLKLRLHIKKRLNIAKYVNYLNIKYKPRKPLSPSVRNELIEYFREDISLLSKLTGRNLDVWCNFEKLNLSCEPLVKDKYIHKK